MSKHIAVAGDMLSGPLTFFGPYPSRVLAIEAGNSHAYAVELVEPEGYRCSAGQLAQGASIVITGNPVDGLTFYGPFGGHNAAAQWAEAAHAGDHYWLAELQPPEPIAPVNIEVLERLVNEAVNYEHEAFDDGAEVSGADLVTFFAEWRTEAEAVLQLLARDRAKGGGH